MEKELKYILQNRIPFEEAIALINQHTVPLGETYILINDISGEILAEDIIATADQPPFPRSPLDGYAFRGEDSKGASKESPVTLKVVEKVCAGDFAAAKVNPGEAVRIMTGAQIPEGANAVIRQEDTNLGVEEVSLYKEVAPYENYCRQGEDYLAGEVLISQGTKLDYTAITVLASNGVDKVLVKRKPVISLLTTGNELIAPGKPLQAGQIYDSNLYGIKARLKELGFVCKARHVEDDAESVKTAIYKELKNADAVITTGGVSVGEKDILNDVLPALKADILFGGIMIKPGSPAKYAFVQGKPVLALSGNPFAAMATLELLGRPMLAALMEDKSMVCRQLTARLEKDFPKASHQRRFIRAFYNEGKVTIPKTHGSGQIKSFIGCNCLIDIPKGMKELNAGDSVQVWMLS
jgi:molybdopterin molybdotransferase